MFEGDYSGPIGGCGQGLEGIARGGGGGCGARAYPDYPPSAFEQKLEAEREERAAQARWQQSWRARIWRSIIRWCLS